jgi:uncharacterized protein
MALPDPKIICPPELIAQILLNYVGGGPRLLYGTDWPISDMGIYLNFLQKIELNTEDRDLIMFKNAKVLFGI